MRGIRLTVAAVLIPVLLSAPAGGPSPLQAQGTASDTTAVLDAARAVLEGITTGDTALIRSVTAPDLRMEGTVSGDSLPARAEGLSRTEFLSTVAGSDGRFVERMWDPVVRVRGRVADVLAPYDFYRGGQFSHCGTDLFHLVETAGGWKVVSIVWTVARPPACRRHPGGPPG